MSDFSDYCCELLSALGPCVARRMFGGYGISCGGFNVALIINDLLYLKADAESKEVFQAKGGTPFQYEREGKLMALGYWTVPSEAMDSPRLMEPWARLAMDAALRAKTKPKAKPKPMAKSKPTTKAKPIPNAKPATKASAKSRPSLKK